MNSQDRAQRRDAFLGNAADYEAVRPHYPADLLREAVGLAGLRTGARLLEIGCGPGLATRWFAQQGFRIRAIDRSPDMVREAHARLRGFQDVEIRCQSFEEMAPAQHYDAVVAATSYHWLDPATRVHRCASLLAPGSSLVLLWHSHPLPLTGFFERAQSIYDRLVPDWPAPQVTADEERRIVEEIRQSGYFAPLEHRDKSWSRTYSRASYEQLLATYSDHVALGPVRFAELVQSIGELIDAEFEGRVERPYRTELIVARRNDRASSA